MIFIHIDQHLLAVKNIAPLVVVIRNQALGIVHVGIDHLNLQHIPHLSSIRPTRAATLWATGSILTCLLYLSMSTVGAQSPRRSLSAGQVNLINGKLSPVHIETVVRSKLTNGAGCATAVFIYCFRVLFLCSQII